MKKILFLLFLCSLSAQVFAQPAEVAAKKIRATEKLSVSGTEVTTIRTAAVDATATHAQLPTAKSVWDALAAFVTTVTTDATLTGAGTSGSPLGIAQQGATNGRVLRWNGTAWVPDLVNTVSLASTGVSAGNYTSANITVGPDGRLTSASSGGTNLSVSGTGPVMLNSNTGTDVQFSAGTGIGITSSGGTTATITNTAPDQVVTISGATGTYPNFTVTPELPSQTGQAGKYLTTDGTAVSWATVSGGGTITGSGAAGRLAYWDGTTSLTSNSNLQTDGTNIGVGVAVNSTYQVDVAGAVRSPNIVIKSTALRDRYLTSGSMGSGGVAGVVVLNTKIPWGATNTYYAVELSYFNLTGNAVNTVTGKIIIEGKIFSASGIYVHASVLGGWDFGKSAIIRAAKNATGELCFVIGAETDGTTTTRFWCLEIRSGLSPSGTPVWTNTTDLATAGYANITNAGDVLRGKTAPFHLNGFASTAVVNNVLQLGNSSGVGDSQVGILYRTSGPVAGLATDETGNTFTSYARRSGSTHWMGIKYQSNADIMGIYSNGAVGIGTPTGSYPNASLSITGSGATSGTYSLLVTNSTGTTATATIAARNDNRVGIATNAPAQNLHVEGTARITGSDGTATTIAGRDADGDISSIAVGAGLTLASGTLSASIPAGIITGSAAATRIAYGDGTNTITSSSNLIYDAFNNRVGIGATPQQNLHIVGNARLTALDTDGAAPSTTGITRMVITDANGDFSFANIPNGTVSTVSVTSANGFAGTVANATTTPAITLSTSVSGLLKGNGTAISSATAGTDYVTPAMSANQTVTTGNYAFIFDASGASSAVSNPVVIKGKADGTSLTQALTFQNAAGTPQSTLSYTDVATYLTANSGKSLILGAGATGYTVKEAGSIQFPGLSVNPSTTGNAGGLYYNYITTRFGYSDGATNYQIARLTDIVGSNSVITASTTLQASTSTLEADANTGDITVTLDGTMSPDFTTIIRATRNNTNAVILSAGSGYIFKVDGDAAVSLTTYTLTAGEIVSVRRNGTKIFIDK